MGKKEPSQFPIKLQKMLPYSQWIVKKTGRESRKKKEAINNLKMDKFQVEKALIALLQWQKNNQNVFDLLGNEGFIYLQFDLSKVLEQYSIRPIQISLPIPIYSEKYSSRIAIFSSQPSTDLINRVDQMNLPMLSEVIGYQQAKKNYHNNKDKVKLLNQNDLFFCDWRIYNLLREPLGKLFYEKKKYPYPIDCQKIPLNLQNKILTHQLYLQDLTNHTYLVMGNGPVYTIKVGRVQMLIKDLVKNIIRAAYRTIPHLLGNKLSWGVIRQISIKTYKSISLPIYSYLSPLEVKSYRISK